MRSALDLAMATAIAVVLGACAVPLPRSVLPSSFPSLQAPPVVTFESSIRALRSSLARAAIEIQVLEGDAGRVIRTSPCASTEQLGCARCELVGRDDDLDPEVLVAIVTAFERHPRSLFEAGRIEHVALCRSLSYEDDASRARRQLAGTVDLEARSLLLSLEAFAGRAYNPGASFTIEDTVHHELFHLLEHAITPRQMADDPEWRALNALGFHYGGSEQAGVPGFVNPYATRSELEDRASVFQYLLARPDELCTLAEADPIIAEKALVVWHRVVAATGDAFLRVRAGCLQRVSSSEPARGTESGPASWLVSPSRRSRWEQADASKLQQPVRPRVLQ